MRARDVHQERAEILELNRRLTEEETRGPEGVPFFRDVLDEALRFRRANGAIVTRDEFLIDLADPANRRELSEPASEVSCEIYEDCAVVSVLRPPSCRRKQRREAIRRAVPEHPHLLQGDLNVAVAAHRVVQRGGRARTPRRVTEGLAT